MNRVLSSRSRILMTVVAVVLLASAPKAIHRIIQTGNPYLITELFCQDLVARLSGPGRLRFVVQPAMAALFGIRHGMADARIGAAPFLSKLTVHRGERTLMLRSVLVATLDLICLAVLLDVVSQALIFHEIHPGAALLIGPVLVVGPYALVRSATCVIARMGRRDISHLHRR